MSSVINELVSTLKMARIYIANDALDSELARRYEDAEYARQRVAEIDSALSLVGDSGPIADCYAERFS